MNATIDIKTPAGQSLEGFPTYGDLDFGLGLDLNPQANLLLYDATGNSSISKTQLHPRDVVTITILS